MDVVGMVVYLWQLVQPFMVTAQPWKKESLHLAIASLMLVTNAIHKNTNLVT